MPWPPSAAAPRSRGIRPRPLALTEGGAPSGTHFLVLLRNNWGRIGACLQEPDIISFLINLRVLSAGCHYGWGVIVDQAVPDRLLEQGGDVVR